MLTLVDGSNMLHRAMWDEKNKLGIHPIRELYIRFMAADPDTFVVWDGYNSLKRRRDIFPGYKQRPEKAEDIKASFDILKAVLCHCPVTQVELPTWEADDVIYSIALDYIDQNIPIRIETNDQDFWQLAKYDCINLPMVKPLPCLPEYTCVYKAIVGDSSDSIPGWRGFGPARWEFMQSQADIVEKCLQTKDYEVWSRLLWPKGIKIDEESFFQCCIFYEVVTMQRVPEKDFTDNYFCGKAQPALAEEIFAHWRI